jgi:hypothetical protein
MWRVVVCDQETSKTRKLKSATGLWKKQPQWVVMPGKQTNKHWHKVIQINKILLPSIAHSYKARQNHKLRFKNVLHDY